MLIWIEISFRLANFTIFFNLRNNINTILIYEIVLFYIYAIGIIKSRSNLRGFKYLKDEKGIIMVKAFWLIPLGILSICYFVYFLDVKKNTPYIEKQEIKPNLEGYIVNVLTFTGYGPNAYRGYTFIKKKNGKYGLKYDLGDWIGIILSVGLIGFLCSFLVYLNREIISEPIDLNSIIFYMIVLLYFIGYLSLIHCAKIVARVYFKKYIKELK
jgi:hypothetical protein